MNKVITLQQTDPLNRPILTPLEVKARIEALEALVAALAGGSATLTGTGHPEGVKTGQFQGQIYGDLDTGSLHWFAGTPGTKTGWIP